MTFIKRLRAYMIVFFLISFAGSVSQVAEAGSRVGNGGDPIDAFLIEVRAQLVRTLQHIIDNYPYNKSYLSDYCSNGGARSAAQRDGCVEFIMTVAPGIIWCNTQEPRTPIWAESIAADDPEFFVPYPQGMRRVVAVTNEGCAAPIRFDYDGIRDESAMNIFKLMAHEFGHKILIGASYINDIDYAYGFDHGVDLLNTFGYALYQYGLNRGTPPLIPQDFGWGRGIRDSFLCEIAVGTHAPIIFSSFSRRTTQPNRVYESITDSVSAYGLYLNQYLESDPLAPNFIVERLYLSMRVRGANNAAGDCVDYGHTNFSLVRDDNDHAENLSGGIYPWNAICDLQRELPILRYRSFNQVDVTLKCHYDGMHRL